MEADLDFTREQLWISSDWLPSHHLLRSLCYQTFQGLTSLCRMKAAMRQTAQLLHTYYEVCDLPELFLRAHDELFRRFAGLLGAGAYLAVHRTVGLALHTGHKWMR